MAVVVDRPAPGLVRIRDDARDGLELIVTDDKWWTFLNGPPLVLPAEPWPR